jgi:CRISPR-associated protein Cas2
MGSVFIVAYDIADDKRRTKVFNKLKGYGEALQYSLFRCILTPMQRLRLRAELWEILNHAEDRLLIIDLGPDDGRGKTAIESWGLSLNDPAPITESLII